MSDIKRQAVVVVSTSEGIRFYRLENPTDEKIKALKLGSPHNPIYDSGDKDIGEALDQIYLALCADRDDCVEAALGIDESWWCRWSGSVLPDGKYCAMDQPCDVFYIDMNG